MWFLLVPHAAALSCDEVLAMTRVEVPEWIVVQAVDDAQAEFSDTDLACLRDGGAPAAVIAAAVRARAPTPFPAAPPCPPPAVAPLPAVLASRARACGDGEPRVRGGQCDLGVCTVWVTAEPEGTCLDLDDATFGPVLRTHGPASCRAVAWP